LTEKNLNINFGKISPFVDKLEGIIEWSNQWFSAQSEKQRAFKSGSEARLNDVLENLSHAENELKKLESDATTIQERMAKMEVDGLDPSGSRVEFESVEKIISLKNKEIQSMEEQRDELEQIVASYQNNTTMDEETRRYFIDEVIYPLLKGFRSFAAFGGRTTIKDQVFESTVILKIK